MARSPGFEYERKFVGLVTRCEFGEDHIEDLFPNSSRGIVVVGIERLFTP
jgi:hypothetical protein